MNRFTILLICIALTFGAIVYTIISDGNRLATWQNSCEVITITVESGDTLDEFGYKYKPDWMDVREYREYIKELNGIESSTLYVGQELKIYA